MFCILNLYLCRNCCRLKKIYKVIYCTIMYQNSSKKRVIIVSNRLPVNVSRIEGNIKIKQSVGGLTTGVGALFKSMKNSIWIGWPGISSEKAGAAEADIVSELAKSKYKPVFLKKISIDNFYYGFCNRTIWPLFHYFARYTEYSERQFESFRRVNELFAEAVFSIADKNDVIWIHDYHLMLLPSLIRKKWPEASIGFFLHIPFPAYEIFRLLPQRREILKGILGADLIGFHTYDYVNHFLDSVRRILGLENRLGQLLVENRLIKIDSYPMGIDYDLFNNTAKKPVVKKEAGKIKKRLEGCKIILSIDRLDYTKGIPERLRCYELFMERYPEYREKVILIMIVVPSRVQLKYYQLMKSDIEKYVGKINGKYGTLKWVPIHYLYRSIPFNMLVALYNIADVALVTPLRDGMNLVAKEYIASKTDDTGVLICSETAGVSKEAGESLIVNPNDINDVADAIKNAFVMSEKDKKNAIDVMKRRLKRFDIYRWGSEFMNDLSEIKRYQSHMRAKQMTDLVKTQLIKRYSSSDTALLLLDYDGTLVQLKEKPDQASPDDELMTLLKDLISLKGNTVVVVSGRDRNTLEKWFGALNIQMIAEHGAFIKNDGIWEKDPRLDNSWKKEVLPLLEQYVDRTTGSFIEEKEFSLAWHYRMTDVKLGNIRARELKGALFNLAGNLGISAISGNKVVEIKYNFVNKGNASFRFIEKKRWDFIMAAGDDVTDEDLFSVLPDDSCSIKIGYDATKAVYRIGSYEGFRDFLKEMVESRKLQM